MATTYLTPGVYVEEVPSQSKPIEGVGTSVAAFVGLAPGGPVNRPMRIANWTQFARLYSNPLKPEDGPFMEGAYLAHSVYGFFQNGGGLCWVVRVGASGGNATPQAALPAAGDSAAEAFRATARDGVAGELTIELAEEPSVAPEEGGDGEVQPTYKITITGGGQSEEFDGLTLKKGRQNLATKVNASSKLVQLEDTSAALPDGRPQEGKYTLTVPSTPSDPVDAGQFEGDVARREGLGSLAAVDEITMLCVPDLMGLCRCRRQGRRAAARHPGQDDRPLRGGEGPDGDPRSAARPAAPGHARVAHEHGGLRLEVRDALLPVARGDGPAHAPADDGAAVGPHGGRLGPHRQHPRRAQGAGQRGGAGRERPGLPGHPRRAGRAQPARASTASARSPAAGSACGAPGRSRAIPSGATSTCAGSSTTSRSRSWRAPSGPCSSPTTSASGSAFASPSRASSRARGAAGALFGATPEEAFFVKCDAETNPTDVIEAGQVVMEIGISPVKPAEFVVFRISQYTAGAADVS